MLTRKPNGIQLLIALLIILVVTYGRSLAVPFYLDDYVSIVNNPAFLAGGEVNWSQLLSMYARRAVTYATFGLNYWFAKRNGVEGFHAVNLLIHLAVTVAVWQLIRRVFLALDETADSSNVNLAAWLAAILVAVHPLNSQAVVYIVQRASLLATLFYVGALYCYLCARHGDRRFWIGVALFSALAVFSKESSWSLPFAFVLLECIYRIRKSDAKPWLVLLPFALWGGVGLAVVSNAYLGDLFRETSEISRFDYFCTQLSLFFYFLFKWAVPYGMRIDYDFEIVNSGWRLWLSIAGHLVVIAILVRMVRKFPVFVAGAGLYYVGSFIEASFIPISDLAFEHRLYLPSVGLAVMLSNGIYLLIKNDWKKSFIPVLLIGVLLLLTIMRVEAWRSPDKNHLGNISLEPTAYRPWIAVSSFMIEAGKYEAGLNAVNKAFELYQKKEPGRVNGDILLNTSVVQVGMGRYKEVIEFSGAYLDGIDGALPHVRAGVYSARGRAFAALGNLPQAEASYRAALESTPYAVSVLNNLGVVLGMEGKLDDAELMFQRVIDIDPNMADAHKNLGLLRMMKK